MSKLIGITEIGVNKILKVFETAELIENQRGKPPRKLLDLVPASWLELVKVRAQEEEQESTEAN